MKELVWKSFAAQEVSHSMAHHLNALRHLRATQGYARLSDIARELQVSKGSASIQMKHLKEKGFVTEDGNRFLLLTPVGEKVVREVRYNRQILIQFLTKVLGIKPGLAETDACKIEHLLSHSTGRQLLRLVQLLQSEDSDARKFLKKFKVFKLQCPSQEECKLCDDQCLVKTDECLICPVRTDEEDS